jgi:hypothetical protein
MKRVYYSRRGSGPPNRARGDSFARAGGPGCLIRALAATALGLLSANADPTFSDANWISLNPSIPGANGQVSAAVADGSGNLYVAGSFSIIGDVVANRIAKWDGSSWTVLGSGMNNPIYALAVSGSDVYAGGDFTMAGGTAAYRVAKWNGSTWTPVGSGLNSTVRALAVSGSDLYAAGSFTTATNSGATVTVNCIAKWNGSSWTNLGSGISGSSPCVFALATAGSNVYAGGRFIAAGGTDAIGIARWDGGSWTNLASGMGGSYPNVYALTVSGSDLYAGGEFTKAGGGSSYCIAKWNGSGWASLGSGISGTLPRVYALTVSGSDVYAGGQFSYAGGGAANYVAKWNGVTGWSVLGLGMNNTVTALAMLGSDVCAGGSFTTAGGSAASMIAKWNGTSWTAWGSGMNAWVVALTVSGSNVYAGGDFTTAGPTAASSIAKWDGTHWWALGSGMGGNVEPYVYALAASGSNVYAGGKFMAAGGTAAPYIANWDGVNWKAVGLGMNDYVYALALAGSDLYAGGNFTRATNSGNVALTVNRVAKWDGSSWKALGSGINSYVYALALAGSDLYAGGSFTRATNSGNVAVTVNNIAKWDGSNWTALGSGVNGTVSALTALGGEVYAGGSFTTAGGGVANRIARWTGTSWTNLGSGMNSYVYALAISGNNLYAGGEFTMATNNDNVAVTVNHIAKWDGSSWSALGSGTSGGAAWVDALAVLGSDLYVGGAFATAGGKVSAYIAQAKLTPPLSILTDDARLGFSNRCFGFSLSGAAGNTVIVEGSTNAVDWRPLQTNTLGASPAYFSDPGSVNMARRFYRARLQ